MDTLLTVPEFAARIRVTVRHARGLLRDGRVRAVNVGRGRRKVYRVTAEEADRFVRASTEGEPPKPRRVLPPIPRLV